MLSFGQHEMNKYFISFTDKNQSQYSIDNPSAFLSQRAIDRRVARNIPITIEDLPVNTDYVDIVSHNGAKIISRSKWFNGITIECDKTVLTEILALSFVKDYSIVYHYTENIKPKDLNNESPLKYNANLRLASSDYGGSYNQIHMINGDFLHDNGFKGEGMLIALLDAGFYAVDMLAPFDSMRTNNQIIATWDFVDNNSSVYEDDSHGMSVLSTIAGNVPGELLGTAPKASFLLLRTEDVGSENIIEEYNWAAAAEYADSAGADIISSSLGYTLFDDSTMNHSYADMDGNHCPASIAADVASSKGMLVVLSAGNSGIKPWHYIGAPSDADSALSIGAVDSIGQHIYFSSFGPSSDGDVKPNVCAQGYECKLSDEIGAISEGSGTSFACPILAGAATCLWQAYPGYSAMEIKSAIEQSSSLFFSPNDSMGYGIPDFMIAGYILTTGHMPMSSKDNLLGVYPNPFSQNLNIRFYSKKSQDIQIEILDALGRLVYNVSEKAEGATINTFNINGDKILKSGIYFVRVSTAQESFVNRVIKY